MPLRQRGFIPLWAIQPLCWLIGIGIAVASAMWAKTSYDERRRDEGRAEVQVKWDKDKAARIKRTTEITLELSNQLMAAKDAAAKQEAQTHARFADLETRVARLAAGRAVVVSGAAAGVLDDAVRAANAHRADAGAEARADPVPAAAETPPGAAVAYDEREFVGWLVNAGAAYADAYNLWQACRDREDAQLAAMEKGQSP